MPWAQSPDTSFLTTPDEMLALLKEAGFDIEEVEDRTEFALGIVRPTKTTSGDGPAPLGVHLIMGADAAEKFKNTTSNLQNGLIAPTLMIARRGEG